MPKSQTDRTDDAKELPRPLSPSVRNHLGKNLRVAFADALAAPVTERLESLIAQLEQQKR